MDVSQIAAWGAVAVSVIGAIFSGIVAIRQMPNVTRAVNGNNERLQNQLDAHLATIAKQNADLADVAKTQAASVAAVAAPKNESLTE